MKKLIVFPADPVESYIKKGEVKKGYYNPGNLFGEIHIINFSDKQELNYALIDSMCGKAKCIIHFVGQSSLLKKIQKRKQILNIVNDIKPDVLRSFSIFGESYIASYIARKLRIPLVISLHDNYDDYFAFSLILERNPIKWLFYKLWKFFCLPYIFQSTKHIIGVYESVWPGIDYLISSSKSVIYNKVYPDKFKPKHVKTKQFTAIVVSNFIPMKNVLTIIKAIEKTNVHLIVIGQGATKEKVQRYVKDNSMQNQITFIDRVLNKDLPKYYNRSDCLINASYQRELSIPSIEAMACKIPIIRGKPMFGSPAFYNGKNMLLVENTPDKIREALLIMQKDTALRKRLAESGYRSYRQINGVLMEEKETKIYKSILSGKDE